jgi:hypothetical protein
MKGEAGDGEERKANGEKTGHQVSQPAKEVAEKQNPVETGQEEVGTRISFRAGCCHAQGFSFANPSISPMSTLPLASAPLNAYGIRKPDSLIFPRQLSAAMLP